MLDPNIVKQKLHKKTQKFSCGELFNPTYLHCKWLPSLYSYLWCYVSNSNLGVLSTADGSNQAVISTADDSNRNSLMSLAALSTLKLLLET